MVQDESGDSSNDEDEDDESCDSYFEDRARFVMSTSQSFRFKDKSTATITDPRYPSVTKVLSITDCESSSTNSSLDEPNHRIDASPQREPMATVNENPFYTQVQQHNSTTLTPTMTIQRTCSEETRSVRNVSDYNRIVKTDADPSSSLVVLNDHQMTLWKQYQSFDTGPNPCSNELPLVDPNLGEQGPSHRRDYSNSGSILTYSEDDTDDTIRWNERLGGSRDEGEWSKLLLSVGDINSFYDESTKKATMPKQDFQLHRMGDHGKRGSSEDPNPADCAGFKVYKERWLMLFYMCILNILSDWTCYSIAPISLLIGEEFPLIDPQALVTIFLISSSISTLLEPMILARVGLRRTIVFGAFLLMIGNIVKSGFIRMFGVDLQAELSPTRTYTGFFLVGLSQPLYQCTPALLSASWFPDDERTLATGLALNSNQLGIGFAFTFGTLLVDSRSSVLPYFSILSILSTIAFAGCLHSLQDAPPTPPSKTAARVIRGNWTKLFKKNDDMNTINFPNPAIQRQYSNPIHHHNPFVEENRPLSSESTAHPWHWDDSMNRIDEGVEPIMIQLGRYLEIDILDDQLLRSIRACFHRAGFIHTLVAFTVSSVVVNVISTYMDYLMRIGGADSLHVGLVGGLFQLVVVVSGILVGKATDQTRAYYSTTIILLVLGAFALAECGIDLDRGSDLMWSLLITAIFVGPLQPIATELGVDV